MSLDSTKMTISADQEAGESVTVSFESGELSELELTISNQLHIFLQFLDPLTRKLERGLTEQVVVEFQEKFPLRMSWNSNDGGASWTYFLAPRVTNDP